MTTLCGEEWLGVGLKRFGSVYKFSVSNYMSLEGSAKGEDSSIII